MSIVLADGFWTEFEYGRIVAVDGDLGAGKTLLGLQMAERLLSRGYRLVTNISCVWADPWDEVQMLSDMGYRAVVLVDEAGWYLRSMKDTALLAGFARKLDIYIILTCKRLPHEELATLTVSPWFDASRNLGLPFQVWRWTVDKSKRYSGFIVETGRSGFYGVYDTLDPGGGSKAVLRLTRSWGEELHRRFGRSFELPDVGDEGGYNELVEATADFSSAARSVRQALAELSSRSGRRRK